MGTMIAALLAVLLGPLSVLAQDATPDVAVGVIGTPTDEALTRTPLLEAPFRLPRAGNFLALFRVTYAPGSDEPLGGWHGPTLTYVESGTLLVELPSPKGQLLRASAPTEPDVPTAGENTLQTGDALVLPAFADHAITNPKDEPAVISILLAVGGGDPGPPLSAGGVTTKVAAKGSLASLPSGPVSVTLDRLTVLPGTSVPLTTAGVVLATVEAGAARLLTEAEEGITVTRGSEADEIGTPVYSETRPGVVTADRPADAAGTVLPGTETTLLLGDGVLLPTERSGELSNAGDTPLVLLLVTITPTPGG